MARREQLWQRVVRVVERNVGAVDGARPLSGGDVAHSYAVTLADGSLLFAKTHADPPPGFFSTEARGLRWMAETETLRVPEVVAVDDDEAVLVLEWIDVGRGRGDEAGFGRLLAAMHRHGAPSFGREDRRSTGSRRLPNDPCDRWPEFYRSRRLLPLARLAADAGALPSHAVSGLESIADRLEDLGGPHEPPARLHGDLWGGNRLVDRRGRSWLIDPACHGGHREFDLAMMRLFGGFGADAYTTYDEVWPLAAGAEERVVLHQLAPLTVHAIKFGGPYIEATIRAIDLYT